jgi:MtN3 and saliva related transmembrane protein
VITLLGITAGTLTTIALLPQLVKTWRSKSAKDISTGMFSTSCLGLLLWTFYGFSINSVPVIVANIVSFALAFTILILKIRYK